MATRRAAACSLALALAATACGGSEADRAVRDTGERLADVRSGELVLRVVTGALEDEGADTGFELAGPFDLAADPPAARFTYTQFVADAQQVSTLTTAGGEAFVEVDGVAYQLDDAAAARLRPAGPLEGLDLSAWLVEPTIVAQEGGVDRIEARLDTPIVLRDLMTLGAELDARPEPPGMDATDADRLRRAARSAVATLETGSHDRLLHRLHGRIEFASGTHPDLQLPGGRFEFTVMLAGHNQPVTVEAPADARPVEDLPGRGP